MVQDYQTSYIYSEVQSMVQEERKGDLKNLFHLLNGIPGALDLLLDRFEERIKSQGVFECERERECVCVSLYVCACERERDSL